MKFGDLHINPWAGADNPIRAGYFVRWGYRSGLVNRGKFMQLTDKKGKFWELPADNHERYAKKFGEAALTQAIAGDTETAMRNLSEQEAIEICERWFAHLDRQAEKARKLAEAASLARKGDQAAARRLKNQVDSQPRVFDGAPLREAVEVLIDFYNRRAGLPRRHRSRP